MAHAQVNEVLAYNFLRTENVILFISLVVLVLSYIGLVGSYSHHPVLGVQCCGKAFWWSPLGCAVVLVLSSLLLRLRRIPVYPVLIIMNLFVLAYSSYEALQIWGDYSGVDKGFGLQQVLLPLYRPLSILLSVFILSITTKRVVNILHQTRPK